MKGHVMRTSYNRHRESLTRSSLARLLSDTRGIADLNVTLLMSALGAVLVALTIPALKSSADAASRTFRGQVAVLEKGAEAGGSTASGGGSPWNIEFGPEGLSASGPLGRGVTGNIKVGPGGISGGAAGGGGSAASPGGPSASANGSAASGGGSGAEGRGSVGTAMAQALQNAGAGAARP